MTPALLASAAVVVFVTLALVKGLGRIRRIRARATLSGRPLVRATEGIDLRVHLFRTRPWNGMLPGRPHLARADLLLAADRLVVASDRGVLVDLPADGEARLEAVRCTGPSRLVLEGEVPNADGPPGQFRLELVVEDASGWTAALAPYARRVVAWAPDAAVAGTPLS